MNDEAHAKRVEELLTVIAKALLAPIAQKEFQDKKLAALFGLTGEATAEEACKKLGMGKGTVIETWSRWNDMGLVIKDGKKIKKSI